MDLLYGVLSGIVSIMHMLQSICPRFAGYDLWLAAEQQCIVVKMDFWRIHLIYQQGRIFVVKGVHLQDFMSMSSCQGMIEFGLTMRVTVSFMLDLSSRYVCISYAVAIFACSRLVVATGRRDGRTWTSRLPI